MYIDISIAFSTKGRFKPTYLGGDFKSWFEYYKFEPKQRNLEINLIWFQFTFVLSKPDLSHFEKWHSE